MLVRIGSDLGQISRTVALQNSWCHWALYLVVLTIRMLLRASTLGVCHDSTEVSTSTSEGQSIFKSISYPHYPL